MRKQKFLEALDNDDRVKALDILVKDLRVFVPSNEELYKDMAQLLTLDDFRSHSSLSSDGDTLSARKHIMNDLKGIIEASALFREKLKFPQINMSRLRRLINQSLNWQHIHCTNPQPHPDMKTLFVDHQCPKSDQPSAHLFKNEPPSKDAPELVSTLSDKWNSQPSTLTQSISSNGAVLLPCPKTPDSALVDFKHSDGMLKKEFTRIFDEVTSGLDFGAQSDRSVDKIHEDLPKTVGRILNLGSSPTSMDFHPHQQTILLVGTNIGDVELWEVIISAKLFARKFTELKMKDISRTSSEDLMKDPCVSVNRVLWSPDGSFFGVAYAKDIMQLYSYNNGNSIRKHLEIDAHVGGVNDLGFSKPYEQLFVIICGNDKLIKVWDVTTGAKKYTFEGHTAAVYSVFPHVKERISFIFSTSTNGEIKAWLYDNGGPRVSYDAPGLFCTRMAYTADGKRLFSCGTNKDGESCIVEWNESEGVLLRTYVGLRKCSSDIVQFGTIKNTILAAGNDQLIKFWNVDNVNLLATVDADGGLPENPHICFNKKGTFLAVSANHNTIKILASSYGLLLLQTSDNHFIDESDVISEGLRKEGYTVKMLDVKPEPPAQPANISDGWNFSVTNDPSQCQSVRLPSEVTMNEKISRLIYTNSGSAILALAANGIHLLWKWSKTETNLTGKPTTKVSPQLWQPKSRMLMTNDLNGMNFEKVISCFSLSKNDCYIASASGGAISLFNMLTFKRMKTVLPPPPAATCIAFYPLDNNIVAIGMEDSTIIIYHFRLNEIISKLRGHTKRITGLAFSSAVNILVSSGADAQIVVWDTTEWEKKQSRILHIHMTPLPQLEIHVQFHHDQKHFLVVHATQLAIYETTKLQPVEQWVVGDFSAQISHATLSCDGKLIYVCFQDGTLLIFNALNFHLQREITPSAYLPSDIRI